MTRGKGWARINLCKERGFSEFATEKREPVPPPAAADIDNVINGFPVFPRHRKEGADRGRKLGTGLDEALRGQQSPDEGPRGLRSPSRSLRRIFRACERAPEVHQVTMVDFKRTCITLPTMCILFLATCLTLTWSSCVYCSPARRVYSLE